MTVLPIEEHVFTLTKNEFRDAIHLRYNKTLKGMPSQCPCGQNYDVTYAMNTNARSQKHSPVSATLKKHEKEKKRA